MLENIKQSFQAGDYEDRAYARALAGKTDPSDETLTHLRDAAARRRIILTAIGLANPDRAKACFEMVRKINADPAFPKLPIEKAISN